MASTSQDVKEKAVVGICAMARKANGKPMLAILEKMRELYGDYLETITFEEEMIINEPPSKWPHCHCLISFYSTGFPMEKAIEYAKMRKPFVINDLHKQYDLQDRVKVYKILKFNHVDQPRHVLLNRDEKKGAVATNVIENPDAIEVNGVAINKPFVEKPVSAEDHNIHIYFPSSAGGGSQRLFRKVNNRSSEYSTECNVRQDGSYLYEEFIAAGGTDVKVYAVGPSYAHAEARKSPALDGKVDRDSKGKEVRYPVMLTNREKFFARRIVQAFRQTVCGFDLLRAGGKSYVVDVNGFSFVKSSTKYYDDTARILGNMILGQLARQLKLPFVPSQQGLEDLPVVATPSGKMMELRCVLAVIRHGDRTPKQKIKMQVTDKRFFTLFKEEAGGNHKGQLKMKKPKQLKKVLELTREILDELRFKQGMLQGAAEICPDDEELSNLTRQISKFDQVRAVLEMYGYFSGINRKVQLKYYHSSKIKRNQQSDSEDDDSHLCKGAESDGHKSEGIPESDSLLLIVKWGGELTPAGVMQAEALGKLFRTLYPGLRGGTRDEDKRGLGFLRLHSTYRHDLKIYASDEGRVQLTAAAFTRGLLALEGELAPILTSMVKSANMNGLLDDDWSARKHQGEVKSALHAWMQSDRDLTQADIQELCPTGRKSIKDALEFIRNPRKMCDEIYGYIQELHTVLQRGKKKYPDSQLYLQETWDLAESRWGKLLRDFRRAVKGGEVWYDISKIPDIYDNIKYDMEHNPDLAIHYEDDFERLYLCVKNMADVLVPLEYGIKVSAKLAIAQGVCTNLMKKIHSDLMRCVEPEADDELTARLDPRASEGISTPGRHVRSRLYFTSESHIHTLMNMIKYGGLDIDPADRKWQRAMQFLSSVTEYNYMTQLVIMLYEDVEQDPSKRQANASDTKRFHIELLFSPGLYPCFQTEKERIYEGNMGPDRILSDTFEPPRSTGINKSEKPSSQSGRSGSSMGAASFSMDSLDSDSPVSSCHHTPTRVGKSLSVDSQLRYSADSKELEATPSVNIEQARNEPECGSNQSTPTGGPSPQQPSPLPEPEPSAAKPPVVNLVALADVNKNDKFSELMREIEHIQAEQQLGLLVKGTPLETIGEMPSEEVRASSPRGCSSPLPLDANNRPRQSSDSQVLLDRIQRSHSMVECADNKPAVDAADQVLEQLVDAAVKPAKAKAVVQPSAEPEPAVVLSVNRSKRQIAYRFKHHTVNLLRDADNRLISTAVIRGDSFNVYTAHAPVVLGTAVIGRSTSAPKLQTLQSEGEKVSMAEIRRFWPPLRSLETMHDNLPFGTLVDFLKRVTTVRTPAPSPPKTPRDLSRENSDLNTSTSCLSPSAGKSRSVAINEVDELSDTQDWKLMSKTAKKLEMLYGDYEQIQQLAHGSKDKSSRHKPNKPSKTE